jgi:CDP-glucose 4,6-dehydratase
LRLTDSSLEPDIRNEATHEIKHQYLSAEKARRMLHWRPTYKLEGALHETIQWYTRYLGQPVATPKAAA